MLMAAVGDIHGNLPALRAVIDAIDAAGIQTLVNTGDCVIGYSWPNEVIDLLRERAIPTVQGEWDRRVIRFQRKFETLRGKCTDEEFDALEWTHAAIRSDNLEFLRGAPRQRALTVDGIPICLCHGSPSSQTESIEEDTLLSRFQRLRELALADIIVCGRTHRAFSRGVDGTLFVNPGAVAVFPGEKAPASYAVIDTESEPWQACFHEVAY